LLTALFLLLTALFVFCVAQEEDLNSVLTALIPAAALGKSPGAGDKKRKKNEKNLSRCR
jgi:hypothetical protein